MGINIPFKQVEKTSWKNQMEKPDGKTRWMLQGSNIVFRQGFSKVNLGVKQ
jgi:hypothetical protein